MQDPGLGLGLVGELWAFPYWVVVSTSVRTGGRQVQGDSTLWHTCGLGLGADRSRPVTAHMARARARMGYKLGRVRPQYLQVHLKAGASSGSDLVRLLHLPVTAWPGVSWAEPSCNTCWQMLRLGVGHLGLGYSHAQDPGLGAGMVGEFWGPPLLSCCSH